ncbi:MAG: hypothetical protein ABDK94_07545 [Atribacterota bacterium]
MITVDDVRELSDFTLEKGLITSFYLNVDPRRFTRQQFLAVAHTLLQEKLASLRKQFSEELHLGVERDFKRIEGFLRSDFEVRGKVRGLVIVASDASNFFRVYHLPQSLPSAVFVGPNPYIRPFLAVLDEHRRIMLVVLDHREARFFEIYMGEILEYASYHSDTQGKVKEGGWYGLEERRIARHIENQIFRHYKEVADHLLEHFRLKHFEYLFVGTKEEEYPLFVNFLHTYLKGTLKGRIHLNPRDHINTIVKEALQAEKMIKEEEDRMIMERFLEVVGNKGLATFGLLNVLQAVNLGACQKLLVDEEYHEGGFVCRACGFLSLKPEPCALCGGEVVPVEDIVERVINEVFWQNGEVKHIASATPGLQNIERIAAFLRFRI